MEQFIETYKEIRDLVPYSFRSSVRTMALSGLSLKDRVTGLEKYLNVPRVQFLYIHHSFRDELHNLDKLLKTLSKIHTFISYSEAINLLLNNKIDKPYISISSDDGFKNNLDAATILDNYGSKACFFINPGLIGEQDFGKIKKHCKEKLHLPPVEFLSWDEVLKLQQQGHEIGGHTMFHENIAEMIGKRLKEDMHQTFETIKNHCGKIQHFAFPYGRFFHFNEEGRKAVFDAGFISCASAERGCHFNHPEILAPEQLCIRRDHVILEWKIDHTMYFIANNARKRTSDNNLFPY